MKGLELFAALVGLVAGLVFVITALRALGELMHEWAGEKDAEPAPPAAHPYEPNGGPRGAEPTFFAAADPLPQTAAQRLTATLPGRRKDNAHDRIEEPSTR